LVGNFTYRRYNIYFSAIGVIIGKIVGGKFKSKAEIFGGIILILIGTKILLEHLGIISF
jgi:putative Mn2+ efflux pump MntP